MSPSCGSGCWTPGSACPWPERHDGRPPLRRPVKPLLFVRERFGVSRMTLPAPPVAAPRTTTATSVLMLLPRLAHTPVVVLTDGPVPSSVRLDVHAGRDLFVRIRRGPSMHGLWEPFRELPYDELPAESAVVASVDSERHVQARSPAQPRSSGPSTRSRSCPGAAMAGRSSGCASRSRRSTSTPGTSSSSPRSRAPNAGTGWCATAQFGVERDAGAVHV